MKDGSRNRNKIKTGGVRFQFQNEEINRGYIMPMSLDEDDGISLELNAYF